MIKQRNHRGRIKYRYGGGSIFTNLLTRKVLADNIKKLVNTAATSTITQKVAKAVQDGATNAIKDRTQKGLENIAQTAVTSINKRQRKKKQERLLKEAIQNLSSLPPPTSDQDIKSGTGIVYD